MMCHRSPLTVQGRSPLLLLFIVLSSLSLFHTPLSSAALSSTSHLLSFSRCLPMPVIFHLSLSLHFPPSFTGHHLYPSLPPLFFRSICSLFLPRPSFISAPLHFCSCLSFCLSLLSLQSIFHLRASLRSAERRFSSKSHFILGWHNVRTGPVTLGPLRSFNLLFIRLNQSNRKQNRRFLKGRSGHFEGVFFKIVKSYYLTCCRTLLINSIWRNTV